MIMKGKEGFTIVELLIVIVVIGILAAISIVAYNGVQNRSKNAVVNSNIAATIRQLETYKAINDSYPVTAAQMVSVWKITDRMTNTMLVCLTTTQWSIIARGWDGVNFIVKSDGTRSTTTTLYNSSQNVLCPESGVSPHTYGAWSFNDAA
jgi:prepilin-type N-terminal cleavage/methylation domain-containing protein